MCNFYSKLPLLLPGILIEKNTGTCVENFAMSVNFTQPCYRYEIDKENFGLVGQKVLVFYSRWK